MQSIMSNKNFNVMTDEDHIQFNEDKILSYFIPRNNWLLNLPTLQSFPFRFIQNVMIQPELMLEKQIECFNINLRIKDYIKRFPLDKDFSSNIQLIKAPIKSFPSHLLIHVDTQWDYCNSRRNAVLRNEENLSDFCQNSWKNLSLCKTLINLCHNVDSVAENGTFFNFDALYSYEMDKNYIANMQGTSLENNCLIQTSNVHNLIQRRSKIVNQQIDTFLPTAMFRSGNIHRQSVASFFKIKFYYRNKIIKLIILKKNKQCWIKFSLHSQFGCKSTKLNFKNQLKLNYISSMLLELSSGYDYATSMYLWKIKALSEKPLGKRNLHYSNFLPSTFKRAMPAMLHRKKKDCSYPDSNIIINLHNLFRVFQIFVNRNDVPNLSDNIFALYNQVINLPSNVNQQKIIMKASFHNLKDCLETNNTKWQRLVLFDDHNLVNSRNKTSQFVSFKIINSKNLLQTPLKQITNEDMQYSFRKREDCKIKNTTGRSKDKTLHNGISCSLLRRKNLTDRIITFFTPAALLNIHYNKGLKQNKNATSVLSRLIVWDEDVNSLHKTWILERMIKKSCKKKRKIMFDSRENILKTNMNMTLVKMKNFIQESYMSRQRKENQTNVIGEDHDCSNLYFEVKTKMSNQFNSITEQKQYNKSKSETHEPKSLDQPALEDNENFSDFQYLRDIQEVDVDEELQTSLDNDSEMEMENNDQQVPSGLEDFPDDNEEETLFNYELLKAYGNCHQHRESSLSTPVFQQIIKNQTESKKKDGHKYKCTEQKKAIRVGLSRYQKVKPLHPHFKR